MFTSACVILMCAQRRVDSAMNDTDDAGIPSDHAPIVIAGGTGFLGLSLARFFSEQNRRVIVLGRREPKGTLPPHTTYLAWDARTLGDWTRALDGAAALVNLTGRTVDCVKTPDRCDEILRSRVESTRVLGDALAKLNTPPPVWVQMSTAHIYGDPPEAVCDESSAFGTGLAPEVGRAWEDAFRTSKPTDTRGVVLRTSFVLGRNGGALVTLRRLARFGLGGTVGSGRQGISWIHEHDMNRVFVRAIDDTSMHGAYVVTAPNPVSNRVFMRTLRRSIHMPLGLPSFSWMVNIGAPPVLRTDPELALYGRYCVPTRLLAEGFTFEFSDIEPALKDLA